QLPDPDTPTTHTYKFSTSYHIRDRIMAYLTYGEGFTFASSPQVRIGPASNINTIPASAHPRAIPGISTADPAHTDQIQIALPVEVISNTEIGLRSDLAQGKLRFNATYFDAKWDGMRVALLPKDDAGNTQPFPYNTGDGKGTAKGWEFEVVWGPTDRLTLNLG